MSDAIDRAEQATSGLLKAEVTLSVRVREAVRYGLCGRKPMSADLLWGVLKASPSVASVFLSNGFDLARLRGTDALIELAVKDREYTLESAIRFAFSTPSCLKFERSGREPGLTEAGQAAAKRGVVTELDIVSSLVEIATFDHHSAASTALIRTYERQDEFAEERGYSPLETTQDWRYYSWDLAEYLAGRLKTVPLIDPYHSEQQFAFYWDGKQIRLVPFGAFGLCKSTQLDRDAAGASVMRPNLSHDSALFPPEAIEELEYLINSDARESVFQEFFERRPEFLLGMEYKRLHPQLILQIDSSTSMIPDFFLERFDTSFVDILDLKRPVAQLAKYPTHRQGLTAAFHEAADQLRQYRNWFEDSRNRRVFREQYGGLECYKPRVIVIMGRNKDFYSEQDRIALEAELPRHLTLRTYDDVLAMAQRYREFKCQP
jgi:hypothetical protein